MWRTHLKMFLGMVSEYWSPDCKSYTDITGNVGIRNEGEKKKKKNNRRILKEIKRIPAKYP